MKNRFPENKQLKTLDIVAGLGKCMIAMKKAGFDAYGFEPSEPFYARALDKMGIDPDRLQLAAMENAEYPEGTFDNIWCGVRAFIRSVPIHLKSLFMVKTRRYYTYRSSFQ